MPDTDRSPQATCPHGHALCDPCPICDQGAVQPVDPARWRDLRDGRVLDGEVGSDGC